jgi:hypothetical protein
MLLVGACGSRSGIDDVDDGGVVDGWADVQAPHEPCRSADGVRLCGGRCPQLSAPECPGLGCTPAFETTSGGASPYGVCWTDRADKSSVPCGACKENEVCIHRGPAELVCTSRQVCDALAELGATDVCRYTDLTPYDGRPIATSSAPCPSASVEICGGRCRKSCGIERYCTGPSPTNALGVCNRSYGSVYPHTCKTCPQCAVFERGGASQSLAFAYGVCMNVADCLAIAGFVGVGCYLDGQRVGP